MCHTVAVQLSEGVRVSDVEGRIWPKRAEVAGDWGKVHKEELCDSHCSLSVGR